MTLNRRTALFMALVAVASLLAATAAWQFEPPGHDSAAITTGSIDTGAVSRPDAEDGPDHSNANTTDIPRSFPKTLDEAEDEVAAAKKPPAKWSAADIAEGKARCAEILKRIHAVTIPHQPIKQGACGAPAPIELVSIGQNPEVAVSPPAIVTCSLAEGLATWLEQDLQPLAQKQFRSPIVTIETMSSYSCRNAYGRKTSKISEHGFANALDIRGFVTASAKTSDVLANWGTPQREIAAQLAARLAAEKQAAALAAASKVVQPNPATEGALAEGAGSQLAAKSATALSSGSARTTIIDGLPKLRFALPGITPPANATSLSIAEPDRLGGPAPPEAPALKPGADVPAPPRIPLDRDRAKRDFLRKAHDAACRIFGTTLGPEANAAHRNHIHVDMAARKGLKICE